MNGCCSNKIGTAFGKNGSTSLMNLCLVENQVQAKIHNYWPTMKSDTFHSTEIDCVAGTYAKNNINSRP